MATKSSCRTKYTCTRQKTSKSKKTLGAGAYGEVFKGTVSSDHFGEKKIEKEIALKQLHIKNNKGTETTLLSFVTEVRNLAAVGSHENIVPFFGVAWRENAFPSIVLEFVAGGELNSYIEEYKYGEDEAHGLGSLTLLSIALSDHKGRSPHPRQRDDSSRLETPKCSIRLQR